VTVLRLECDRCCGRSKGDEENFNLLLTRIWLFLLCELGFTDIIEILCDFLQAFPGMQIYLNSKTAV
jgi:hypothetical protein